MTDSMRALRALCQRCGKWREAVNQQTDWTCRECHLEAQGQRLLAVVEARGRERDVALQERDQAAAAREEAIRQATALHQSLVNATAALATARADGVRYGARAIEAREVAAWLLAEWTDPANWGEAITAAETKFGKLDWLREGKG